jgi:hypothetical protein
MRPLGLLGGNQETRIDSPVKAAAFMSAGGPGTAADFIITTTPTQWRYRLRLLKIMFRSHQENILNLVILRDVDSKF